MTNSNAVNTDEANQASDARAFYLRGAYEGALAFTSAPKNEAAHNSASANENGQPGEHSYADALRQRYQKMSREELFDRVLSLEGYVFGLTGNEAPQNMELPEDDGEDWGDMDESLPQ